MSKAEDGAAAATTLTCKQQRQAGSTDLVLFKSGTLLEKDARSWGGVSLPLPILSRNALKRHASRLFS